jgi:hypothetical protein
VIGTAVSEIESERKKPIMFIKTGAGRKVGYHLLAALSFALLGASSAVAQKNEFGVLIGSNFTGDRDFIPPSLGQLGIGDNVTFQVVYGRRIVDARAASLHLEFLLAGTPEKKLSASNVFVPQSYSSLFFTPGLKLKIFPGFFITPYIAAGGGYARFNQSDVLINGQPNGGDQASNRLVYDYGGGIELKIFPAISLRGEIRDFVSGTPGFNFPVSGGRQHNLIPAAGLVIRF